jgi:hypothetical protein
MPNSTWTPKNAPAAKQEFNSKSAPSTPVSKPELERLTSQREHPQAPVLQPKPPSLGNDDSPAAPPVQNIKQQKQIQTREARIQHIRERLDRQQGRAQSGFQKANIVPKPDPVSKQEVGTQKQEINQREARVKYIQQRLSSRKDRARDAFNRAQ